MLTFAEFADMVVKPAVDRMFEMLAKERGVSVEEVRAEFEDRMKSDLIDERDD